MEVGEFAFPIDPVENSFWGRFWGGENRSLCIVIPSAAEGSFLHCGNQRVCAEGKRCLGADSHATISVLP